MSHDFTEAVMVGFDFQKVAAHARQVFDGLDRELGELADFIHREIKILDRLEIAFRQRLDGIQHDVIGEK
jgi:hypothetical protein